MHRRRRFYLTARRFDVGKVADAPRGGAQKRHFETAEGGPSNISTN